MSVIINKNTATQIDPNVVGNSSSTGAWKIVSTNLVHDNNLGSYIDLDEPIIIGDTYRLTYIISSYTSCSFRMDLGNTHGITRTSTGTFTEVLVHTGLPKIRFWSNGFGTISHYKLEHLATILTDTPIDPIDGEMFENKSWTISYSPILEQHLSFHSYLPNNYIIHPSKLLTKRNDTQLKLFNSGDYGKYFDEDIKPWILETVFNDNALYTKAFDNITVNLESKSNSQVATNKFFDNIILYNEFQTSGVITLDTTNLTKKEKNWMINRFTDLTNNTSNSLFSEDWTDIASTFPIDKVVNSAKIDTSKPWYQRARFRDKYLIVRFTENNATNNEMTCKFIVSIYRTSER